MSKSFFIATAFLVAFLVLTPVAIAQEDDSSGFAPAPTTTPEPTIDTTQALIDLKNQEMADLQMAKDKHASTFATASDPTTSALASNYKLNAILVSARYHKTLEAYITYLQNINQGITNVESSGLELTGSDAAQAKAAEEMATIANLINQYDIAVDNFSGMTDSDIAITGPRIKARSDEIKTQLETTQQTLLNLVRMMQ